MTKRNVRNAYIKSIARPGDSTPEVRPKVSREEWVIRVATRVVGTRAGAGFVQADDFVSDIILKLMNAGGFAWEEDAIEEFCRKQAAFMVRRYVSRRERNECEFTSDDNEDFDIMDLVGSSPAMQDTILDAKRAVTLLAALPHKHRRALEILCGGGNPIDVAEDLNLAPWDAVRTIKEARDYIRRVDPLDEAA